MKFFCHDGTVLCLGCSGYMNLHIECSFLKNSKKKKIKFCSLMVIYQCQFPGFNVLIKLDEMSPLGEAG